MTDDHSWVDEQVRAGTMSATAARQHPWRNVVTRALSGGDDPEVDTVELDAASRAIGPALLGRPVGRRAARGHRAAARRERRRLDGICERLIDAANEAGGPDNITVLVLEVELCHNLAQLLRYRGLIQSLVARELKARYRGSVLGFFWSFVNPLTAAAHLHVRLHVRPAERAIKGIEPYPLFMFCGLLPWTWFSSSLTEASGVADLRRQPDQEGAVPGRDPADRHRAVEHDALLPRRCRSWLVFLIYYQAPLHRDASCCASRSSSLVQLDLHARAAR